MIIPILDKYSLSLDGWVLAALITVFTAYLFWLVKTLYSSSTIRSIRIPVILLRTGALILFICMITDLHLSFSQWKNQPPQTLVLYDLSRSMDSVWTPESLREWHIHPLSVKLDKETRVSRYGGGEKGRKLRKIPEVSDLIEHITDFESLVGNTLGSIESVPDQILFLTDGRNLKGMETEQIRFPSDVPWIVIGVGDTLRDNLPVIAEWILPGHAAVNDTVQVSAVVLSDGYESVVGQFLLQENNRIVNSSSELTLHPAALQTINFTFVPQTPGISTLKIVFKDHEDRHLLLSGHSQLYIRPETFSIVVDGRPHPDLTFILNHLRPRNLYNVFTADDWETVRKNEKPDLLILGSGYTLNRIKFRSVPVLYIKDSADGDYGNTSGFQIVRTLPFTVLSSHPALDREIWSRFPPVNALKTSEGEPVIRDESHNFTLISVKNDPKEIILNGNGFWRWAWSGYNTEREGSWTTLVNHIIEWLVSPQPDWAWLELPEKELYAGISENLMVYRSPSANPGELTARIFVMDSLRSPVWNSSPINLLKSITPVRLPGLNAGSYLLTADIYREGERLNRDSLFLYVGSPDPELLQTGCDMNSLRRWAARQNGEALHLDEWEKAEQFLDFSEKYKRHVYRIVFRRNLYWILFLLLLLTTEWIFRKGSGSE